MVAFRKAFVTVRWVSRLTSESVESTSLPLQSVDNIHSGDCLPLCVLGVGDGITDDVLKEYFENTTGLLVDQSGNTLDSTTSRQASDCWLGNSLDVIAKYFPVPLGSSLSQTFASLSTSSHVVVVFCLQARMNIAIIYISREKKIYLNPMERLGGRW